MARAAKRRWHAVALWSLIGAFSTLAGLAVVWAILVEMPLSVLELVIKRPWGALFALWMSAVGIWLAILVIRRPPPDRSKP